MDRYYISTKITTKFSSIGPSLLFYIRSATRFCEKKTFWANNIVLIKFIFNLFVINILSAVIIWNRDRLFCLFQHALKIFYQTSTRRMTGLTEKLANTDHFETRCPWSISTNMYYVQFGWEFKKYSSNPNIIVFVGQNVSKIYWHHRFCSIMN